jgi:prevent-host-death family protein
MITIKNILPVTTVKRDLMKLLKSAKADGSTFLITKDGRAEAVLMSAEEYEGLIETLAILSHKKTVADLKKAKNDVKSGRLYRYDQVFDE